MSETEKTRRIGKLLIIVPLVTSGWPEPVSEDVHEEWMGKHRID
jgi:hypothetical protein